MNFTRINSTGCVFHANAMPTNPPKNQQDFSKKKKKKWSLKPKRPTQTNSKCTALYWIENQAWQWNLKI